MNISPPPLRHVPVIDISPFRQGNQRARQEVADAVRQACEQIGFLVITGHGIPEATIENLYSRGRDFFSLTSAEKLEIEKPAGTNPRGYTPYGTKTVGKDRDATLKPSLMESFAIGSLDSTQGIYYTRDQAGTSFSPNLWPRRPEGLKLAMTAYYRAMEQLAVAILDIFALALNVPEEYFRSRVDRHTSTLRVIHYPSLDAEPQIGEERAGAHTDTTAITILRVDDAPGGLQVQMPDGEWVGVPKVSGSFIINIGDIMMRWTNDRFISTMHRVVNPPLDVSKHASRISIPYFCMPNYDAVIECVPSCIGTGKKYPPVTSGELLTDRYRVTYSLPEREHV